MLRMRLVDWRRCIYLPRGVLRRVSRTFVSCVHVTFALPAKSRGKNENPKMHSSSGINPAVDELCGVLFEALPEECGAC